MLVKEFKKVPLTARIWTVYAWIILLALLKVFIVRRILPPEMHDIFLKTASVILIIGLIIELIFIIPFIINPKGYLKSIDKARPWLKMAILVSLISVILSWVLVAFSYFDADETFRDIVFWVALIYSPAAAAIGNALGTMIGFFKQIASQK